MSFITNMEEYEAAKDQVVEYVMLNRHDDDKRIEQLITEMELFVLNIGIPEHEVMH